MRKGRISVAGASILFALGLAAWEVYFFWYAGSFPELAGRVGLFTPDRLGFNMAWLAALYLTYQLISIPFSLPSAGNRFIGVVDGMASLVPLAVVLIVVFGKPQLVGTTERWEAACLLIFITIVDLFGGDTSSPGSKAINRTKKCPQAAEVTRFTPTQRAPGGMNRTPRFAFP
jgi:hypothetical protein